MESHEDINKNVFQCFYQWLLLSQTLICHHLFQNEVNYKVNCKFGTLSYLLFFSSMRKDSIAEPFYGLIGEIFELKGGK